MSKQKRLGFLTILISAVTVGLLACSQFGQSKGSDGGPNYVKKDAPNTTAVAKIFGQEVSAEDLEKASPDIFSARIELYETQKRAIDEKVRESVFEELAKKANLSVDEFTKKEMDSAKKKVGEKEVAAFLKERNVGKPEDVPAHIKDQVRGLIHMNNLLADYTKRNPVEIYLKRPTAPSIAFNFDGDASYGPADAKVTIVEFSDFQCPFCSKGKDRVNELKKEYGKKIRVVFKHFPLPMHPEARPAHEASMCIYEQSPDKFWKYHDKLFDNQQKLAPDNLKAYAKDVGADVKKFEECFGAKKYAALVDKNMEEARKLGVNSTPTFFVNSQPVRGARPLEEFKEIIDEALGK